MQLNQKSQPYQHYDEGHGDDHDRVWVELLMDELGRNFSECKSQWKCLHAPPPTSQPLSPSSSLSTWSSTTSSSLNNNNNNNSSAIRSRAVRYPWLRGPGPASELQQQQQHSQHPPAVSSGSLVCFPGKRRLCLFGGMTDQYGTMNETWIYELGLQLWKKVEFDGRDQLGGTIAMPRTGVASGGAITVGHHAMSRNTAKPLSSSSSSPSASSSLTPLGPESVQKSVVPPKRCGHVSVTINSNEMLMFGGHNVEDVIYYNDVWLFRPDPIPQWRMLSPFGAAPKSRWYASAVTLNEQLIIYGGEGEDYEILGDVAIYSKHENRWLSLRTVYPSPRPRMLHSANMIEESMIVIGGIGSDDALTADVWRFDTKLMVWFEIVTTGPSPFLTATGARRSLYGHQSSVWGSSILVYGGKHDNMINSAVWLLDLERRTWTEVSRRWSVSKMPPNRWKHMLCSDYYSHVSSKSHLEGDKERLSDMIHQQKPHILSTTTGGGANANGNTSRSSSSGQSTERATAVQQVPSSESGVGSGGDGGTQILETDGNANNAITLTIPSMNMTDVTPLDQSHHTVGLHALSASAETPMSLLPAEVLLQKLTRTYIYGGAGQSARHGDLWEFTLQVRKSF